MNAAYLKLPVPETISSATPVIATSRSDNRDAVAPSGPWAHLIRLAHVGILAGTLVTVAACSKRLESTESDAVDEPAKGPRSHEPQSRERAVPAGSPGTGDDGTDPPETSQASDHRGQTAEADARSDDTTAPEDERARGQAGPEVSPPRDCIRVNEHGCNRTDDCCELLVCAADGRCIFPMR